MFQAGDVEALLRSCARGRSEVSVKLIHTYDEWVAQNGTAMQVGSGLTMNHYRDAVQFLREGLGTPASELARSEAQTPSDGRCGDEKTPPEAAMARGISETSPAGWHRPRGSPRRRPRRRESTSLAARPPATTSSARPLRATRCRTRPRWALPASGGSLELRLPP
ncbi:unnamed protein product, partial [Prorocentrum cordatum]